ncbi:MAG TPA: hypothetical protein VIM65_21190 [Cyclobacteriaceae bacterium]
MKVKSKIFKGIEYIQIAELPQEQQEILAKTLNKNIIIKILMNGKVVRDCIQFKDYQTWYENIFKADPPIDDSKEKSKAIFRKGVKANS